MTSQRVLDIVALTDIGLVRAHNEDAIEFDVDEGLMILADGMGGYNAGEIASKMCVDIIKQTICTKLKTTWMPEFVWQSALFEKWLAEAIQQANTSVLQASDNNPQYAGMGTTVVAALCHDDKLMIAHVGDSRAYRYRNGVLEAITRDHSVLQAQIDAGLISEDSAQYSPIKNLITRAVGAQYDLEVETHSHQMHVGDIYLFCSDGLSDMLAHQELSNILAAESAQLEQCCTSLIHSANANGGRDNISVLLMRVVALDKSTGRFLLDKLF